MWTEYDKVKKRKCDFRVKYEMFAPEDGGRRGTYQGLRCDFMYAEDVPSDGIYMIHPEFENQNGTVLLDENKCIETCGTARMWIVVDEMREYHKGRISVGKKGFFMGGSKKIGRVEVIEVCDL